MNQDEHKDLPAFIIVSPKDIAARAYEIYLDRGASEGFDREDWLRAEQELTTMPADWRGGGYGHRRITGAPKPGVVRAPWRTRVQKGTAPSNVVAIESLNYDEP